MADLEQQFIEHLDALNRPIFHAPRGTGAREFAHPSGWSALDAAGNWDRIEQWRPGDALCVVLGGPLAGVDVDTKNGASIEQVRQLLAGLGVRIFAEVATPSGGRHFYVVGHPDLPTVHADAGRDGLTGYPGVEILSHGTNVFLPGTSRPKYDGAGYTIVFDDLEALADGGDPDGADALAGWVAEHRARKVEQFAVSAPWTGAPPDKRQQAYLDSVLRNQAEKIAAMGPNTGRNVAVYEAGLICGNYVAGAGMDERLVFDTLEQAAAACGLLDEDGPASVRASIASGLRNGKQRPRAVPAPQNTQNPHNPSQEHHSADIADFAAGVPIPLDRATHVESFPVDALPEPIADMVRTVAESTQTDLGMAGCMALGALSAAAGGFVEVEPRPGYREPVPIWPLVIALPGERKSSVSEAMVAPLHDLEQELADRAAPMIAEQQTLKEIAEKAAEKAKRDAGNAVDADKRSKLTAEATALAASAAGMTVPALPRIVADDVTPEAMTSLLAEQGGRLAIVSAEGGLFNTFAGRYDNNPDLTAFLKAHAGDRIRVDRKGRPSEFVNNPALTLALMIQPGVLATASGNKLFHDSGLMARFLYSWPMSRVGERDVDPAPMDQAARVRYADTLHALAHRLRNHSDVQTLALATAADAERLAYAREIESAMAEGGELAHMRGWASKVVGAAIRIAGLIHVASSREDTIGAEAMRAGIRLARYFTSHALRVFDGMAQGSDERALARRILGVIERQGQQKFSTFTERELVTVTARSWLPTIDHARPALALLVEFGWLDPVEVEKRSGPGRKPSPKYRVHPSVFVPLSPPQNTQNLHNPTPEHHSADSADIAAGADTRNVVDHVRPAAALREPVQARERLCPECGKPLPAGIARHLECVLAKNRQDGAA